MFPSPAPANLTPEELEAKRQLRLQAAQVNARASGVFAEAQSAWMAGDIAEFERLIATLPAIRTDGQALGLFNGRPRGRGQDQGQGQGQGRNPNRP